MTALNTSGPELTGVRLPLQPYSGGHAVFMYSTAADGNVTLQLKEPDDLDKGSLAAMLARLQDDATFSISYQDTDILSDGSIDVLLGNATNTTAATTTETGNVGSGNGGGSVGGGNSGGVTATFDLFDSSSGPDLTLSPQTFTNSAEAFINDNSNSLGGVPQDQDAVSTTTDDKKIGSTTSDVVKLAVKRQRPKAASPNRQGPQQCQICAKVFGNASALAKHKLTHSDERKYVCTMCGKAFKRQDHLNGHMLTHRNKKPYECKAEGCGKSYCDARSLRRHTENHHSSSTLTATSSSTSSSSSSSSSSSTTTMSPAQGAASGDAASPHGSSCIQYAPPPTTSSSNNGSGAGAGAGAGGASSGKSQLQQLLSAEPAKGNGSGNNDGLTKQQLDLIHQIMEQTQRQSQSSAKPVSKPTSKPVNKTLTKIQRTWSSPVINTANKNPTNPTSSKVTTTTPSMGFSPTASASLKTEQKPVECNLCHRKFKNIPALNGHMRLHGGYFKKDTDNKKCEKKEQISPPLQTASVSVRALIEEKIINRRTTSTTASSSQKIDVEKKSTNTNTSVAPPLLPLLHESPKITSFIIPALPTATENLSQQSQTDNLADLILNTNTSSSNSIGSNREKVTIKRTVSDPGQTARILQFNPPTSNGNSEQQFHVPFQNDDASGYLSPPLQEEVFTQVQDTMLLQGVDAQQLASIQFQAESILQDQSEQLLEEYTSLQRDSPMSYQSNHSVNQDLQAVLDSPLPESLADFSSTFHSPYTHQNSPRTSISTQSPLQSPSLRHERESPVNGNGFSAYPTPPASHEAQSPCFGSNPPLDFAQVPERGVDEPPHVSSPLSAAFFTSTMSSSAAVEEALEEVLPGETIAADDDIYPLSDSPAASPSPVPRNDLQSPSSSNNNENFINFSLSPANYTTFQSQMLPNSDDPLLSSSPKDCGVTTTTGSGNGNGITTTGGGIGIGSGNSIGVGSRKKIELNGVPLRLISNHGLIDLNSGNFAGILVDANGEIKLIQTGNSALPKNFVIANCAATFSSHNESTNQVEEKNCPKLHKILRGVHCSNANNTTNKPKQTASIVEFKKEEANDVFLSPNAISQSPLVKVSRKRPRSSNSSELQFPVLHQSKLRARRSKPQSFTSYTPQPILNPNRSGTGLYSKFEDDPNFCWTSNEAVPETDSTPHINVGLQFQARIPPLNPSDPHPRFCEEKKHEDLLWDPGIHRHSDNEVDMYLDFACCAAVPGSGRNKEYAMHLLQMCGGNIHEAMLKLMQPSPSLPSDHPLVCYQYSESDKWSSNETELFYKGLLKYDKDFRNISQEIGTKTIKQCIQFYYFWKKVCVEEYRRMKQVRERKLQNSRNIMMDVDFEDKVFPDSKLLGIVESGSPMPNQENRNFICEFADCSASFNSRAALNGHIRIHGGTTRNSPSSPNCIEKRLISISSSNSSTSSSSSSSCHLADSTEDYPCKICGKIFTKIKSRSAHMKSHRPIDNNELKNSSKKEKIDGLQSSFEHNNSSSPSVPNQ